MSRNVFVLSGGGSRGAAQIGMLRALLGAGVAPDLLVGASVGAINSCFLAAEPTTDRVEHLADKWMTMDSRALTGPKVTALGNLARRRPYLYSADRLRALVADWMGDAYLEDLTVPVRVATTHLVTGKAVHHDRGPLSDLIAASAALPAVFPPVMLDGAAHVDAGVAENVPLSGVVDVLAPGDRVWVLDVTKAPLPRNLRNPLDVLIAALVATMRNQARPLLPADVAVTTVKLDETFDCGPVFDFTHTGDLFRLGEAAATTALLADARH